MTDANSPDPTPTDDDTAWPETTEPRKDNAPSDVDRIIEENTSVNGIDPDAG